MGKTGLMLWVLLTMAEVGPEAEAISRESVDVHSQWVAVDGVLVHYLERPGALGSDSPTILLIHGWLGSSFDFSRLLPELPANYRLIALDLPGCGRSQQSGIKFAPGYFEDFVAQFARALGVERTLLVGHSMGGAIAVRIAAAHPHLIERLVLIDPYGMKGEEGALGLLRRSRFLVDVGFLLNNRPAITIATKLMVFYDPRLVTRDYVESIAEGCLTQEGRRAQATVTREVLGRRPVDDLLPQVKVDTLVIWGNNDHVLSPAWAKRFAALLPNAEVELVDAAGHLPQFEAPAEVARLIERFACIGSCR